MLAVLVSLGTWRVYRLRWKERISAQIAVAETSPALPLMPNPAPDIKVSVRGRLQYDRLARVGAEVRDPTAGPTMGFYQIVPFIRDGASGYW